MNGEIIRNDSLHGDYFRVVFYAPEITQCARPGQFVHVRIDRRGDHILRRPFSIHDVSPRGEVVVVYKVVGAGTKELSRLNAGDVCDLLGPQGRGFSNPPPDTVPVIVAGGYGAAATFMLTRHWDNPGVLLLGARSGGDIILTDDYAIRGFEVRLSTNDGSVGHRGFVTDLIEQVQRDYSGKKLFFYGCGPHPMLMALAKKLRALDLQGELSIDHLMCCGVGACFGCVVKVNAPDTPEKWRYARACADGPVFNLRDVYVE